MNIAIIGCGAIGRKRAYSLGNNTLKAVADISLEKAMKLAGEFEGVKVYRDWNELIELDEIDIVIISTTNNWLAPITLKAIEWGKHILVEKPGAIHYTEFDKIIEVTKNHNIKVKIGYNLRYHPSFIKLQDILIRNNELGNIMFITTHYGHGGRVGYEKEWRADKRVSGGGETLDQGVHCLDLCRWLLGDFTIVNGSIHTYFWNMDVEDNAFIYLENKYGNAATIQVSCTEWKNTFLFEIYFKYGKVRIEGLGGSYGTEKLTLYQMKPEMGIPDITTWEFHEDNSFQKEFEDFVDAIKNNREIRPNLEDGKKILEIVNKIYQESEYGKSNKK